MEYRTCTNCLCEKHINEYYYIKKSNTYTTECKEYYKNRLRFWRVNNKGRVKIHNLMQKFGIDINDYNKLFEDQGGYCAICGRHQMEFKKSLAIDHDHDTGIIRGLLCGNCNTSLGLLKENKSVILSLLDYLDNNLSMK